MLCTRILGKCEKRKQTVAVRDSPILSRKCLVIVGPNTKTRNEGNRVGRPLFVDQPATCIGRLRHHVETRNRKPAGTSMATCVLPICSTRQRETSVILFSIFFQGAFVLHRYALFLAAHSGIPRTVVASPSSFRSSAAISRGIYGGFVAPVYRRAERFASARFPDAISHSSRKIARYSLPTKNGSRARATRSNIN